MSDFTIGERSFRAERLEPITAFHVARRIAPLLGSIGEAAETEVATEDAAAPKSTDAGDLTAILSVFRPISKAMAEMSDADVNYIIDACTRVVKTDRGEGRGWTPIGPMGSQFDWIDWPTLLRITFNVIQENVMNFLPAGAQAG